MRTRPYLIAEIGVNHDGDAERAIAMVGAAAQAGFDAVKFQHWVPEELLASHAPNAAYQGTGNQHELLAPLQLSLHDLREIRAACRDAGVDYGVTPDGVIACSEVLSTSPDFLKIGSGDADNPWLLEAASAAPIPLIISTGMCSDEEVLEIARRVEAHPDVTLLHCVSAYPTRLAMSNLGRVQRLAGLTGRPVGWSDHTEGSTAAVAAVALGAVVVEKHVTYDCSAVGPDHAMSLPLSAAPAWVAGLHDTAAAVFGSGVDDAESENRLVVRKALYAVRSLARGHVLAASDLVPLRPLLDGLPAIERDSVIGRRLVRDVSPTAPLRSADIA